MSISIGEVVQQLISVIVQFWNFLDLVRVTPLGGDGFSLLQIFIAIYVLDWAFLLFFIGLERGGDG